MFLEVSELGTDRQCLGRAAVGICDRGFAAVGLCDLSNSWILMLFLIFNRREFVPS